MASKSEISKKIIELEKTAGHCLELASELKIMTGVSTPVLKRNTSKVKLEMRAIVNSKFKNKKAASVQG